MQNVLHDRFARNRSRPLEDLEQFVNHMFGGTTEATGSFLPAADVVELDSGYQICMELPGVKPDDVTVEFVDGNLQISGEKKTGCCGDAKSVCHRSERRSGPFTRTFQFKTDVDADKIAASFENGVLCVTLPKAPEILPKKIQIKAGN